MSIVIKNLRFEKPQQEWQVRVDRSCLLGNPFVMHDESERDIVCDFYEKWFFDGVKGYLLEGKYQLWWKALQKFIELYRQYGKLELFCWCAPKRCHAETIRDFIKHYASEDFPLCKHSGCECASVKNCLNCEHSIVYREPDCIRDATGLEIKEWEVTNR